MLRWLAEEGKKKKQTNSLERQFVKVGLILSPCISACNLLKLPLKMFIPVICLPVMHATSLWQLKTMNNVVWTQTLQQLNCLWLQGKLWHSPSLAMLFDLCCLEGCNKPCVDLAAYDWRGKALWGLLQLLTKLLQCLGISSLVCTKGCCILCPTVRSGKWIILLSAVSHVHLGEFPGSPNSQSYMNSSHTKTCILEERIGWILLLVLWDFTKNAYWGGSHHQDSPGYLNSDIR